MERRRNEIIPGVEVTFTKTGIDGDVVNAWSFTHVTALLGEFDSIEPVKHYAEYFKDQDKKYEEAGKPGLFKAVMERSNPRTVALFDQLVDDFNTRLPQIIENRDVQTVQEYVGRAYQLKEKLPEDQNSKEV